MTDLDLMDDKFNVSNYIKTSNTNDESVKSTSDNRAKIAAAIEWMKDSNKIIIIPTDDLDNLEKQWIRYCDMPVDFRHESDWKSLEIFGVENHDHYDMIKDNILNPKITNPLKDDLDSIPVIESYFDIDYYEEHIPSYDEQDIKDAVEWAEASNRVIIVPTRNLQELEDLWDAFQGMILKHREESDWKSEEIFGLSNLRHYEYLKLQFLRQDSSTPYEKLDDYGGLIESRIIYPYHRQITDYLLKETGNSSNLDITKALLEMVSHKPSVQEEVLSGNLIDDILDKSECISTFPTLPTPYGDVPMIEPDEMIDKGVFNTDPEDNFYGVHADNLKINESTDTMYWFEHYRGYKDGICTQFTSLTPDWINKLRELTYGLNRIKESGDIDKINARKQSILELGWDPEIPFNSRNMKRSRDLAIYKSSINNDTTRVVDLQEFVEEDDTDLPLNEGLKDTLLKPIFIVLTEGQALHSKIIMKYTHSKYSHASIALDPSLEEMYSFSMDGSEKGWRGGFVRENVKDKNDKTNIGVYTFFVSNRLYEKAKQKIKEFSDNVSNTFYSYANLASLVFNIPWNRDQRMICSQFVDNILKFIGVDITRKDSSVVNPGDLGRASKKSRRIYTIYEGLAKKYNKSKIIKLLNNLITRAKPMKEVSSLYYTDENSYIHGIISNIHNYTALMEMEDKFDIVKDERIRRIIDQNIFSVLRIEPYAELTDITGDRPPRTITVSEIDSMISKFIKSY